MIPQRIPSRVDVEHGVRDRVAACRQRLRNTRITHREANHSQIEDQSVAGNSTQPPTTAQRSGRSVSFRTLERPVLGQDSITSSLQYTEEFEEVGIT